MKKPEGVYGTGVSLGEMRGATKVPDARYLRFMLRAAVEKLECAAKAGTIEEAREVIARPEWIEDDKEEEE